MTEQEFYARFRAEAERTPLTGLDDLLRVCAAIAAGNPRPVAGMDLTVREVRRRLGTAAAERVTTLTWPSGEMSGECAGRVVKVIRGNEYRAVRRAMHPAGLDYHIDNIRRADVKAALAMALARAKPGSPAHVYLLSAAAANGVTTPAEPG